MSIDVHSVDQPWESWSDSRTLYLRPIPGIQKAYEYLVDFVFLDGVKTYLRHGAVFLNEYLATKEGMKRLESILTGFGYDDIRDFVQQNLEPGEKYPTAWLVDPECPQRLLDLAASLVVESLELGSQDPLSVCFEDGPSVSDRILDILRPDRRDRESDKYHPVEAYGFACDACGKELGPADFVTTCPDCGAVICAQCADAGAMKNHRCEEE